MNEEKPNFKKLLNEFVELKNKANNIDSLHQDLKSDVNTIQTQFDYIKKETQLFIRKLKQHGFTDLEIKHPLKQKARFVNSIPGSLKSYITAMSFYPETNLLAIGTQDEYILLFLLNLSTQKFIQKDKKHHNKSLLKESQLKVNKMLFISKDKLISSYNSCHVIVWKITNMTLSILHDYKEHLEDVRCLIYLGKSQINNRTCQFIASGADDGLIKIWDILDEKNSSSISELNVKNSFKQIDDIEKNLFCEALLFLKNKKMLIAMIKSLTTKYVFFFETKGDNYSKFDISKKIIANIPGSQEMIELDDHQIGLTGEETGSFIIFDYIKDPEEPTINQNGQIITKESYNIIKDEFFISGNASISMMLLKNNFLLYVSSGRYVVVNIQKRKVEKRNKLNGECNGLLLCKINENEIIIDNDDLGITLFQNNILD